MNVEYLDALTRATECGAVEWKYVKTDKSSFTHGPIRYYRSDIPNIGELVIGFTNGGLFYGDGGYIGGSEIDPYIDRLARIIRKTEEREEYAKEINVLNTLVNKQQNKSRFDTGPL